MSEPLLTVICGVVGVGMGLLAGGLIRRGFDGIRSSHRRSS